MAVSATRPPPSTTASCAGSCAAPTRATRVEVWFEGGGERSESFTYQPVSDSDRRVLIVAAEDYTGASPVQAPGPHYLSYFVDALRANGISADVYDVDARGRTAPDHIGVLGHYDTRDLVHGRRRRHAPRRLGRRQRRPARDGHDPRGPRLHERGRPRALHRQAGRPAVLRRRGSGRSSTTRRARAPCNPNPSFDPRRCLNLRGSRRPRQRRADYWFGGYVQVADDGNDPAGGLFDVDGVDVPFAGLSWGFNGPASANNQTNSSSFVATSGILPVARVPAVQQLAVDTLGQAGRPVRPAQRDAVRLLADRGRVYKRLTRDDRGARVGGNLTFWTSYDTEAAWDHLFVEARTPGGDDWTTLPDANGHTTHATGDSCPARLERAASAPRALPDPRGRRHLHADRHHRRLARRLRSFGRLAAVVDRPLGLRRRTVEISIAYVSDWAVQNLGMFLDDVTLPDGTSTSFETDLGGWTVTGPPPGSGPNGNNFVTDASGFPVGASITTPDSILTGYGFEGIATPAERNAVMRRVLSYLR